MSTSCVVLNESLLSPEIPPVSALNPAFVVSLSLGRELARSGAGAATAPATGGATVPVPVEIVLAGDDEMRRIYSNASATEGCRVHPYPLQALTGNYEAYAQALKSTPAADVRYLAIGILAPDERTAKIAINAAYADPAMTGLLVDAGTLGFLMGRIHTDETFSRDVEDADGNCHRYLTCIGHFFRKEKPGKLSKLVEAASQRSDIHCLYIPADGASSGTDGPRMVALWSSMDTLKELKVHQMSGARMHEDLVAFRSAVDAGHQS